MRVPSDISRATARRASIGLVAALVAASGYFAGIAHADGIPTGETLFYSGVLQENDALIDGPRDLVVELFDAETGGASRCRTEAPATQVASGRFRVPLSVACVDAVTQHRDLFAQVSVGTSTLPRMKVGAVPYAVWAERALSAESLQGLGATDVALAADVITAVTAGTGLSGGGPDGDVELAADTTFLQRRVTGSCAAGSSIRTVSADGTVTCETDSNSGGTLTGVTASTGLSGGGSTGVVTVSADTNYLQRRVSSSCAAGSSIRAISATGAITCDDGVTSYETFHLNSQTASANKNTGTVRKYCALTRVKDNNTSGECQIIRQTNGTWTLYNSGGSNAVNCEMTCFN